MGSILQEHAILEASGFVLARVADDVSGVGLSLRSNRPLFADGKTGAATAAEAGGGYFLEYVFGYGLVSAGGAVFVERFVVSRSSFGKEDHNRALEFRNCRGGL